MKRADLVLGSEYMMDSSTDWRVRRYGSKVRIVDMGPFVVTDRFPRGQSLHVDGEIVRLWAKREDKGNCVAVRRSVPGSEGLEHSPEIVTVTSLRVPWAEWLVLKEELDFQWRAKQQARKELIELSRVEQEAIETSLRDRGIKVSRYDWKDSHHLTLSVDDLRKLLLHLFEEEEHAINSGAQPTSQGDGGNTGVLPGGSARAGGYDFKSRFPFA